MGATGIEPMTSTVSIEKGLFLVCYGLITNSR